MIYNFMPTGTAKWIYTSNQTVTITLASLFGAAISNAIDNTNAGYLALDIQIKVKTGFSVSGTGLYGSPAVGLYLIRTVDGSLTGNFDQVTGSGLTATSVLNLDEPELLTIIYTPSSSTTYIGSARIENVPQVFKFLFFNATGGGLDSTAGNHYIKYSAKILQI